MKARNISVTFHIDVYDSKPWFQIPQVIAKMLNLRSGDVIAVSISTPKGKPLYHGLANMGSGREVYRSHVSKRLKKGEEIRVTLSRPPEGAVTSITSKRQRKPRPFSGRTP